MRNIVCLLIIALSVAIGNAQNRPDQLNLRLKTGDLLFCRTTAGDLSKAIDQATQTGKETHYSHVGIIDIRNDTIWVLHSAPEKGVCCEVLSSFLNPENEKRIATAYRLKDPTGALAAVKMFTNRKESKGWRNALSAAGAR